MSEKEGPDMAMPATAPPDSPPETIEEAFEQLAVPAGYRAELIEGEIVVSPPPDGHHEGILSRTIKQVIRKAVAELDYSGNAGIVTPNGRFIPDATFVAGDHIDDRVSWDGPAGVELVVEVTSGRGDKDRVKKRRGYAAVQIPLYLLVDREAAEVVLFSKPADGEYHAQLRQPFGKGVELPEPFGFTLDTTAFG